jgi:mono/diheme cytochrome c family protein
MKKYFKWIVRIFGGLILLLLFLGLVLYWIGIKKLKRSYPDIAVEKITIPTDPVAIVNGKHLSVIWACTRCHGENLGGMLFRHDPIDGMIPLMGGSIPASNLTSGRGGIAASYKDADWVRAIRHGVKPNGEAAVFMYDYSTMSDADLADLIAYLKQIAPVDAAYPRKRYGPILPVAAALGVLAPVAGSIDHNIKAIMKPMPGPTKEFGGYLSASCTGCHGGGPVARLRGGWSKQDFVQMVRTGVLPNGRKIRAMPQTTYGEMTDQELEALWLYFKK